MIRSVRDAAFPLISGEAEVEPVLYTEALDSQRQWKVLCVQLRISPEGLILCWGLSLTGVTPSRSTLFLIFCGGLCSKLGCQVLCAALLKLWKCHHWMISRIKEKISPVEPLRRACCSMAHGIFEFLCMKRRGELTHLLKSLPSVWKTQSSLFNYVW